METGTKPRYDTSQLLKDSSGLIRTGAGSSVNPEFLSDVGFQQATAFAQAQGTKPLASITTDNAVDTLNKNVDKLNGISPTTAPGYTPPPVDTKKAAVVLPKAFFTNENGQDAEYNQDQLNDPNTQKFLRNNGFVMTKTEGPTLQAGELSNSDKQLNDLFTKFQNYNVDADPSFAAEANGIRAGYNELRTEILRQKEQFGSDFNALATREGLNRYTPGRAADIRAGIAMDATHALGSILLKEQQAISSARKAYAAGKFTEFNTQMTHLEKIRDDKATQLTALNKTIQDALEDTRKETKRMTMEQDISGLLNEGYTDPQQINEALGFKYATKDVADTLKNLAPENDLEKLPAETREFFVLKGQNQLPPGIVDLPENQQLFAYLAKKAAATRAPKEGEKGPVVSLSNIKEYNLPVSTFGLSQQDVLNDLQSETPPKWFIEKVSKQLNQSVLPESPEVKQAWEDYRTTTLSSLEEGGAGGP